MQKFEMIKKTVIVGDSGVGKNTFLGRIYNVIFKDEYIESIGALIGKYDTRLEHGRDQVALKLLGWDITGQERFDGVRKSYLEGTDGAIIMGRTDRKESIGELACWTDKVYAVVGKVPVVYVINKVGKERRGEMKVRKLARQENTKYWFFDFMMGRKDELVQPVEYLGRRIVDRHFEALEKSFREATRFPQRTKS